MEGQSNLKELLPKIDSRSWQLSQAIELEDDFI